MSELEDQISRILSDPGELEKLTGLARSLMGGGEAPSPAREAGPLPDARLLQKLGGLLQKEDGGREAALLAAMRPWLSEKRQRKMDRAMQLARMAKLARLAMGEMGGGDDPPL